MPVLQCALKVSTAGLPHLPTLPPPVTVKHRVVKFHEISLSKE